MVDIVIKQHSVSLTDEYEIYTNGVRSHSAYKELLRFYATLVLSEYRSDKILLKIEKTWWPFGPHYFIYINNKSFLFETKSWLRGHYRFEYNQTVYEIYACRDNKYKVVKNGEAIASWTGQSVTMFEGDKYVINTKENENNRLLIAFCLIIDHHYYNNASFINFNIGPLFAGRECK